MTTYLTIITTALVITQIIRVTQNTIQLHRQNVIFKEQIGQLGDITQDDLDRQKETYKLLYEYLKEKKQPSAEDKSRATFDPHETVVGKRIDQGFYD